MTHITRPLRTIPCHRCGATTTTRSYNALVSCPDCKREMKREKNQRWREKNQPDIVEKRQERNRRKREASPRRHLAEITPCRTPEELYQAIANYCERSGEGLPLRKLHALTGRTSTKALLSLENAGLLLSEDAEGRLYPMEATQ
jgi:hypothetical protein